MFDKPFSNPPHFRYSGDEFEARALFMQAWKFADEVMSGVADGLGVKGPFVREFSDGTIYHVEQAGSELIIDIYVPPSDEGIERGEKKEEWRFVPAFCLGDVERSYDNGCYVLWYTEGGLAICADANWEVPLFIDKPKDTDGFVNFPYEDMEYPSRKKEPYLTFLGNTEIIALQAVGGEGHCGKFDRTDSRTTENEQDLPFSPGPIPFYGTPYWYGDGSRDRFYSYLFGDGDIIERHVACGHNAPHWGGGCGREQNCCYNSCEGFYPAFNGDGPDLVKDDPENDSFWERYYHGSATGTAPSRYKNECLDHKECESGGTKWTCSLEWKEHEHVFAAGRCGAGHLFAEVKGVAQQRTISTYNSCNWSLYGGMCQEGGSECSVTDKGISEVIDIKEGPSEQVRKYRRESTSEQDYFIELDSGEEVIRSEYHVNVLERVGTATLANCKKTEEKYSKEKAEDVLTEGECGSVVSEGNLKGAWMALYHVEEGEFTLETSYDPWTMDGYGYSSDGTYNHGSFGSNNHSEIVGRKKEDRKRTSLYVTIKTADGEQKEVLLDQSEWLVNTDPYDWIEKSYRYQVTESLILDFFGTPVFMYGYVKILEDYWDDVDDEVKHVRYGYFMGSADKHYQSQKFYDMNEKYESKEKKGISNAHDVFGVSDDSNYHAFGRCCGFAVRETKVEEGD